MIITNTGQIINNNPTQFFNTGQVVQGHISHLIQGPDNTVQMITPSGATQLLHIQRSNINNNDRCEIIVQPSEVGKYVYIRQYNVSQVLMKILLLVRV